jgi:cadherin EGF LAG seven-pass G-type receptor 1
VNADSYRFILCPTFFIFVDGVNEVKALMQLTVRLITEDMLFNSITVRLDDMTEEAFLSPLLTFFIEGLAAIIPCPKENIFVFSIQVSSTSL